MAASMRMSFFLLSARRPDTSTTASRPNAVAAMNAIFCATASCLPTGWPHCTRSFDHSRVAREWSKERVQWGQPVGKHDAVAQKIAFIAATAFGLEAVVDVSGRLADNKKNDIRIEAAIAKLYGSEMAWKIMDELLQVRGGRGFETAESLKARGEKPIPVEQALRDMRINRIFEGSTEIMHLLIAREAVDQHLQVAGDILDGETALKDKARSAVEGGGVYAKWVPPLPGGGGERPGSFSEFGPLAKHLRYVERHSRKLARSTF